MGRDATQEDEEVDGRRRRSLDSRARIVAAMLELVRDGNTAPNAVEVAARAGVGLRSVFRHFKDMESLYLEMTEVMERELMAVAAQPFKGPSWRDRVMELVARRGEAFEVIAPFRRAADGRRHDSEVLRAEHVKLATTLRDILRRQIPPDAIDRTTFEALDLLLSYEAWSRLRLEQGLSPTRSRETVERAVRRVIGDDG